MFFLAEYLNMVNVSAVVVTLFLGGYHFPFERAIASLNIGWLNDYVIQNAWLQPIWLTLKLVLCICLFVWLRGSLPPLPLRPVHGAGLEGADPGLAGVDHAGRPGPADAGQQRADPARGLPRWCCCWSW